MKHELFQNEISFTKIINRKKQLFKNFIAKDADKNPNEEFMKKMKKTMKIKIPVTEKVRPSKTKL